MLIALISAGREIRKSDKIGVGTRGPCVGPHRDPAARAVPASPRRKPLPVKGRRLSSHYTSS